MASSRTIKPVEAFFGAIATVAEAAAAGAIKEGAKRARGFVREIDGGLGKVERMGAGELEVCEACGRTKREHDKPTSKCAAFVGAPRRPRKRTRKIAGAAR
jgi:hypothetical protein